MAVFFLIFITVLLLLLGAHLMGSVDAFINSGRCRPYWDVAEELESRKQ